MGLYIAKSQSMIFKTSDENINKVISNDKEVLELAEKHELYITEDTQDDESVLVLHNSRPNYHHIYEGNIFEIPEVQFNTTFDEKAFKFFDELKTFLVSNTEFNLSLESDFFIQHSDSGSRTFVIS